MKDKRNCGMNYPIYQPPVMVPPMAMPYGPYQPSGISSNTIEQQLNNIEQQLNMLEQRITRLEKSNNTTNNYTKYNDSNYYMV